MATLKYSKRCKTCQLAKKNKIFRTRLAMSKYVNPMGHETVLDILEDFPEAPTYNQVYSHLKKHKFAYIKPLTNIKIQNTRLENERKAQAATIVQSALEGEVVEALKAQDPHVQVLDQFISIFGDQVRSKDVKIKASDGLKAIQIKADILKGNKDRTADLVKTLAGMAAPNAE